MEAIFLRGNYLTTQNFGKWCTIANHAMWRQTTKSAEFKGKIWNFQFQLSQIKCSETMWYVTCVQWRYSIVKSGYTFEQNCPLDLRWTSQVPPRPKFSCLGLREISTLGIMAGVGVPLVLFVIHYSTQISGAGDKQTILLASGHFPGWWNFMTRPDYSDLYRAKEMMM